MFVANYLTQDLTFYENDECVGKHWPALATMGVSEGRMIRHKVQRREPLFEELRAFAEAVRYGRAPVVSGEDGIAALAMAHQIIRSGIVSQSGASTVELAIGVAA